MRVFLFIISIFIFLLPFGNCFSQQKQTFKGGYTITGTIYDISARRPLDQVAVLSTGGLHSYSDSTGKYSIEVHKGDSIYFQILNKSTLKYPVDTIKDPTTFNIMIYIKAADLPGVLVRSSNYLLDSLANRREYEKYFNYRKPSLRIVSTPSAIPGSLTVGLDLDNIIDMFRVKRNRSLAELQKHLLDEEQNKYIDHRFSKLLVSRITGLKDKRLNDFMIMYRPSYYMLQSYNDLELSYYINQCYRIYKVNQKPVSKP